MPKVGGAWFIFGTTVVKAFLHGAICPRAAVSCTDAGIRAEYVYTCAEGPLFYAYVANPVSLSGM